MSADCSDSVQSASVTITFCMSAILFSLDLGFVMVDFCMTTMLFNRFMQA
jgi:hypothetical protein